MKLENREKILHIFHKNSSWTFSKIAEAIDVSRQTVLSTIYCFKESLTADSATESHKTLGLVNKNVAQKIFRSLKQNPGLCDTDRGQRYQTTKTNEIKLRLKSGYQSYQAIKHPNSIKKQELLVKSRSRLL